MQNNDVKKNIEEKIKDIKAKLINKEALGTPCEVYTRITGYYRPTGLFNFGKVSEFEDRLEYQIELPIK
jgi:anaerobic ribonucleoside-triphosphate reductase